MLYAQEIWYYVYAAQTSMVLVAQSSKELYAINNDEVKAFSKA